MKIIIFKNDDDFEAFCLKPNYDLMKDEETGMPYYNTAFNDLYLDEVKNGTLFCIDDQNSNIRKRNSVTKGVVSKRVENVIDLDRDDLPYVYKNAEIVDWTE